MTKKNYTIDQDIVKFLGFEETAYLCCLKDNPGNVIETGYRAIQKEHPFWSWGKQKKIIKKLLAHEAIALEYTDAKQEKFRIILQDTILEKPKPEGPADPREIYEYVLTVPITGQGPTEVTLKASEIVAKIIAYIVEINPGATVFYGRPSERKAILDMLDQGYDPVTMLRYADALKYTYGKPYSPVISSPSEFANKFSKLAAYIMKEQEVYQKTHNKFAF